MKIQEGYMPYLGYKTYFRIVGERHLGKQPLVLLHGGPGSTHNYFELLDNLANDGRQLIMYDQLGCGKSSIPNDETLWTKETWVKELIALRKYLDLDKIHLLGQSWGGMLALIYLCDYHPDGISSVILSSTLSSAKLWSQEQHRMINNFMSKDDVTAIDRAEKTGDYADPEYLAANELYMEQHATGPVTRESPEPLRRPKKLGIQSYQVAWGPNEYSPTGTLKNYDYTSQLKDIDTPTLITSGINDLCTPLVAKTMFDGLPNSKWELFAHSRHKPFADENKKYQQILSEWLIEQDV